MIPVLNVNCTYKNPSTFGDVLVIKTKVTKFTGVQMCIGYEITNKKTGDVVLIGETRHCFTNTELKPINLKKHDEEAYHIFINYMEP